MSEVESLQVALVGQLQGTTLSGGDISALLALRAEAAAAADVEPRVNVTAPDGTITWLNDLERDARYERWPRQLKEYLQPVFPGQVTVSLWKAHTTT